MNSDFTISHNLGTRDLHVTVRQNGGNRSIVEPLAVTLDGEDDLTVTEPPALNGYVVTISTAGPVSAFQAHGHTIAQIEGLQLILDDLGGRVEDLESFIPFAFPVHRTRLPCQVCWNSFWNSCRTRGAITGIY